MGRRGAAAVSPPSSSPSEEGQAAITYGDANPPCNIGCPFDSEFQDSVGGSWEKRENRK